MMPFALHDVFSSIQEIRKGIPSARLSPKIRFGEHRSVFKGQGHDFYQVRPYDPERDSIQQILWHLMTPDSQTPLVREAIKTKEVVIIFVVDLSSSMTFALNPVNKQRLLLETLGVIGLTAAHDQDRIGLIGITDTVVIYEPPRTGRSRVYYLLKKVYDFMDATSGQTKNTSIPVALSTIKHKFTKSCIVFLISDFVDDEHSADSPLLKIVAARHELTIIILHDPQEFPVKGSGYIRTRNPESGKISVVPLSALSKTGREIETRHEAMQESLRRIGVGSLRLSCGDGFETLSTFFETRRRR